MKVKKVLTTKEAAQVLGVNESRVRQLILRGQLRAVKFGAKSWMIEVADLRAFKERRK